MIKNRSLVFVASCLGMLLFGVVLISIGSLLPGLILQFGLDELEAGSLASLLPLGILAGTLVFGPIADRYGYKLLLIACALLIMVGLEGIAFSQELVVLQIFVLLIGIGGGAINGATNALVSDISDTDKGANLSLLGVFFGVGALGMPLLLGLLSKFISHSSIVAGIGGMVLFVLIFYLFLDFPQPKHEQGISLGAMFRLLRSSLLWVLGLVLFFESSLEGLASNWTTTYLERELGILPEQALFALTLLVLGLAVTRLLLSGILRSFKDEKVLAVSYFIILLGILTLAFGKNYSLAVTGLVILGAGFAAVFPVVLGWAGERFAEMSGTAFSMVLLIAISGNMLLNYLMGLIGKLYGLEYFPLVLLICWALMGGILVLKTRMKT